MSAFKKILAVICSFSLVLTLGACGEKKNTKASKESKESVEPPKKSSVESISKAPIDKTLWTTKMVCFTFDDGPQESNGELLDILKAKGVKATFFLQGNQIEKYPELVKRMIAEGHDLGWHSYEHNIGSSTNIERIRADFQKAQQLLNDIGVTDYKIKYLRCPGGAISDNIVAAATELDWRIIGWTNYGFDDSATSTATPEERANKTFEKTPARNGEVVLIHPRTAAVAQGVGCLIDNLQAQGYKVVSVSEILQRKNGANAGEVYGHGQIIY